MTPRIDAKKFQGGSSEGRARHDSGFSLVELLVVVGMMGLVAASVQSLYVTNQRSATVEAEVVDVQQNLRVGMDSIRRDLEMAGFLIQADGVLRSPIAAAVDGGAMPDSITLNTASGSAVVATIAAPAPGLVVLNPGDVLNVAVMPFGGSQGVFEPADVATSQVRIVDYQGWLFGTRFTVTSVNAPLNCGVGLNPPCLIGLTAVGGGTGTVRAGLSIVQTGTVAGGEVFPNNVQLFVAACPAPVPGQCLMRTTAPPPAFPAVNPLIVATNVTDLQFRYLLDDLTEINAPVPDLSLVRGVRVTINGQIVATVAASGGALKQRSVMSVVGFRNRGVDKS